MLVSILICALGVGLWRLYSLRPSVFPLQYQHDAFAVPDAAGDYKETLPFVASKAGTKYYPVGCKSVSRIKDENKIYFASAIDAQKAGFQSSGVCQ